MNILSILFVTVFAFVAFLVFFPELRGWLAGKLGIKADLSSIIADFEKKAKQLEAHAADLVQEAREHLDIANVAKINAEIAQSTATRAQTIANNVKNLIDAN